MVFRKLYGTADIDPRVLEIEQAHRGSFLRKLQTSFRDPNDNLAWLIITWVPGFLALSFFLGMGSAMALASLISFLMAGYRRRYYEAWES